MRFGFRSLAVLAAVSSIALMGNNCSGNSASVAPQTAGTFVTLNEHHYPGFNNGNYLGDSGDCLSNPDVPVVVSRAQGAGWQHTENVEDAQDCSTWSAVVHASNFTDSAARNADFLWFSGHGDRGVNALYSYDPNNADANGGYDCLFEPNPDTTCFYGLSAQLPIAGRLKFIFAFSSQNSYQSSWQYLFNGSSPGVHGYFGIAGEPNGNRGDTLANAFFNSAVGQGRLSIRDAWMNAVTGSVTNVFGIWQLQDAQDDVLSSSGSSSSGMFTSSNPLLYTDAAGTYVLPRSLTPLNDTSPGTYQPAVLQTESYSDASLAARSDAYSPGSAKYFVDGNTYQISGADYVADHYEGSQGIIVSAAHSGYAFNYAQSDAQTFAESFLSQQGNPLPGDAVLQSVKAVHNTPLNGSPVTMGYIFNYAHSNNTFGGDGIRIGVDNYRQRVCLQPNENDPPNNKPNCLQWGYNYNMHVNFLYRLWRTATSSVRYPLGSHGSGSQALTPNQALQIASQDPQVKGVLGTIQGYLYSYFTPPIDSTDNTAYPAYHFFSSNGVVVSADAYSGEVLGIAGDLN